MGQVHLLSNLEACRSLQFTLTVTHFFLTYCPGVTSPLTTVLYLLAHLVTLAWDILFSVFPLPDPKCIPRSGEAVLTMASHWQEGVGSHALYYCKVCYHLSGSSCGRGQRTSGSGGDQSPHRARHEREVPTIPAFGKLRREGLVLEASR